IAERWPPELHARPQASAGASCPPRQESVPCRASRSIRPELGLLLAREASSEKFLQTLDRGKHLIGAAEHPGVDFFHGRGGDQVDGNSFPIRGGETGGRGAV